jgi:hypothetical protein
MKTALPWVLVVISLAGLGFVYSASQKKEAELQALRAESAQLQQARADLEDAKKSQTEQAGADAARVQREHDELLRLRNEVQLLRQEKVQMAGQVRSAQAQAQSAQANVQTIQARAEAQAQAMKAAVATPAAPNPEQANLNACVNNLRMLDGAKAQWALEHQKPAGALMTAADLAPYLPNKTVPGCPAGGTYTLNPVGINPICSVSGHAVSK